jgi:hypothetical protein
MPLKILMQYQGYMIIRNISAAQSRYLCVLPAFLHIRHEGVPSGSWKPIITFQSNLPMKSAFQNCSV